MTARTGTSDGLAPVVDDLAVDHEVDVETAADLAGSLQHAFLAHAEPLRDRTAAEVVHTGAQLCPMQPLALVAACHQRLRGARHETPPDEPLVEPKAQLSHVVRSGDHQVTPAREIVAAPDAVPVERAAVVDPRLDVRGLRGHVGGVVDPVEPTSQAHPIRIDQGVERIGIRWRVGPQHRATAELDVEVGFHVRTLRARHSSSKMPYSTESRYPSATRIPSRATPSSCMPRRSATARDRALPEAACSSIRWSPSSSNAMSKNRSQARVMMPRPSWALASQYPISPLFERVSMSRPIPPASSPSTKIPLPSMLTGSSRQLWMNVRVSSTLLVVCSQIIQGRRWSRLASIRSYSICASSSV